MISYRVDLGFYELSAEAEFEPEMKPPTFKLHRGWKLHGQIHGRSADELNQAESCSYRTGFTCPHHRMNVSSS